MFNFRLLGTAMILTFFLASCGPAVIVPPAAQPLPSLSGPGASPADSWHISLDQSGGFAGVQLHVEVSSDGRLTAEDQRSGKKLTNDLDAGQLAQLSELAQTVAASSPRSAPRSTCADCFLYDLQVTSGAQSVHVQADDTTLASSGAQELISLLQQLRDSTLKG